MNLPPKSLKAAPYVPSSPRTGGEGDSIYRMKNFIVHGRPDHDYIEVYGGNKDLSENISTGNLSGVSDIGSADPNVIGAGTAYRSELRPGQIGFINSTVLGVRGILVVESITSDTAFVISKSPSASATSQVVTKLPVIFEINRKRGTLEHGNALQYDKGTILCVGEGTLRINGSALAGTSLVATKKAKIALFNPNTQQYSVYPLGMNVPATLTAAAVGGGAKNMQAGLYSVFVTPARQATGGYNNPSPKAEVTLTAGQKIQLTIPAADTTNGQDAWMIWASLFTDDANNHNGPWYFVKQITTPGDVATAGGTYTFEYNDGEIERNDLLTFDNDPPSDAEFLASLAGFPIYISCQGPGYSVGLTSATNANPVVFTTTVPHHFVTGTVITISGGTGAWAGVNGVFTVTVTGASTFSIPVDSTGFGAVAGTIKFTLASTSPGPMIIPAKPNNIEAAPLQWATALSPPEPILGCISATSPGENKEGVIYLMTANSLQIASFIDTGGDPTIPPVAVRPFWKAGFKHPYQLCFVNGILYGFTTQGPTRSSAFADPGSEEHTFAASVREIVDSWVRGHVFVAHCPLNNAICFFHSDDNTNASGFHTTRVLMFGLDRQDWIGDIVLESTTGDMFVSGVASVSGRLEFIAGGRQSDTSIVFRTYHFDSVTSLDGGAGTTVPWYVAWQFTDDGSELRDKVVKGLRVTAKLTTSPTIGIHGADAGEVIDVPVLEAGNSGSKSGSIALTPTAAVTQSARIPVNVPNLAVWTVRVDGTWDGSSTKDRVDEVVIERAIQGVRR